MQSPEYIFELIKGFQKSRILLSAFELDIFSKIGDMEKDSAEIAKEIEGDPRATDRLLNALCSLNLLSKKQGKFSNTQLASKQELCIVYIFGIGGLH